MVQIKFKKFGSNTAFGGFSPGDVMRAGESMARQLVEQGLADYAAPPAPKPAPDKEPEKTRKPRRHAT